MNKNNLNARVIAWFSCGAASAVATKLTLQKYKNVVVCRIVIRDEDKDNQRFANDCEKWFGVPIVNLINEEYNGSVDEVIKRRRYMSGTNGAPCTFELKKKTRWRFQLPDDKHVFGFHIGEERRLNQILDAEPELNLLTPLINEGLTKEDCHAIVERAGIKRPRAYDLGFKNANCRGCVKANSAHYWNLTRQHYLETFEIRSAQEVILNTRLVKMRESKFKRLYPNVYNRMINDEPNCYRVDSRGDMRFPLRYLPVGAGDGKDNHPPECGILCEIISTKFIETNS